MELAHANRVATIGQLTASIGHEVKQPISATATNAAAALRWLGAQPPNLGEARQALDRIVNDAMRAGDIIGRIRDLIQKAPPHKDSVDINEAIREVIELTRGEAVKTGVSGQTHLADGLPLVHGDRVQLQQVNLNLIINAIDAMSDIAEASRELLITTGQAESGGVLVAVRDLGPGLAPTTLERLFEPFYTTKPNDPANRAAARRRGHRITVACRFFFRPKRPDQFGAMAYGVRCTPLSRGTEFAEDSSLEEDGFEPSVPLTGYPGLFRERVGCQKVERVGLEPLFDLSETESSDPDSAQH
jgi:hypothetical protein